MKKLILLLSLVILFFKAEATPFVTEWNITKDEYKLKLETSPNHKIEEYDITIDWGDGTIDHNKFRHTYQKKGTYFLKITGKYPGIVLGSGYKKQSAFITVKAWGDHEWLTMRDMFSACSTFEKIEAKDLPNLSKTICMDAMFCDATKFNDDIGHWDVSNVKDMIWMFKGARSFNQNIGHWNVSNVSKMSSMFRDAFSFDQDLSNWDVSKVQSTSWMFAHAIRFDQDISKWDVSSIIDMQAMFRNTISFDQDISHWDVSNVFYMDEMFLNAKKFDQDIGTWDVSKVINMHEMFKGASAFNQDISRWDVSEVYNMGGMFKTAINFDQALGKWDIVSVKERVSGERCGMLNPTSGLISMLDNSNLSSKNYEATLKAWAKNPNTPKKIKLGAKGMRYKKSKYRKILIKEKGWTIVGDEKVK